jgi:hypothetical protein
MSYLLCSLLLVNLPKSPHYLVVSTRHFGMLNSTIINHPMWGKKMMLTHRVSQKLLDKSARNLILANSGAAFGASNLIFG